MQFLVTFCIDKIIGHELERFKNCVTNVLILFLLIYLSIAICSFTNLFKERYFQTRC